MGIARSLHALVDAIVKLPGLRQLEASSYASEFARRTDANLHRGVYASYADAQASSPPSKPVGYDNNESAQLYRKRLAVVASDYPALFWVGQSISDGQRTFVDLGGSIGIKYYAFSRLLDFPADLRWHTIDVPAAAKAGSELAMTRDAAKRLTFSFDYADMDGCEVLFVSGSAQYLPEPLAVLVGKLKQKPARIIVNTTPIHPSKTYYTLNSIGTAFCPYRIESRYEFVSAFSDLGYSTVDLWENSGKGMHIPGFPDHDVEAYSGFCFDLKA